MSKYLDIVYLEQSYFHSFYSLYFVFLFLLKCVGWNWRILLTLIYCWHVDKGRPTKETPLMAMICNGKVNIGVMLQLQGVVIIKIWSIKSNHPVSHCAPLTDLVPDVQLAAPGRGARGTEVGQHDGGQHRAPAALHYHHAQLLIDSLGYDDLDRRSCSNLISGCVCICPYVCPCLYVCVCPCF